MMTIRDMANRLGVSVSSVSRALSGKSGVSTELRDEVLCLARESGYSPNANASHLRSGSPRGVTVITPIHLPEIARIRNSVLFRLCRGEFGTIRVIVHSPGDDVRDSMRNAVSDGSRAVILSHLRVPVPSESVDWLRSRRIPLVSMDGADIEGEDVIWLDRSVGTYQAARLLLLSGCRKPVFFSMARLAMPDDRLRGIIAAYRSLNLNPDEISLMPITGLEASSGVEIANEILNTSPVDGMFCFNDRLAVGALRALYKAGVRVPEQVRVIGFDDDPISELLPVSLTTVAQPVEELAAAAVSAAMRRAETYEHAPERICFPTRLVVRESAPIHEHSLRERIFESMQLSRT